MQANTGVELTITMYTCTYHILSFSFIKDGDDNRGHQMSGLNFHYQLDDSIDL